MKLLDGPTDVYDFAYAYAITCWKAQGSEWNKVLFFEEEFPYDKETHKKYLYTGITRASKKLVIIRK
jgi:exodeoxyribonuclease-5